MAGTTRLIRKALGQLSDAFAAWELFQKVAGSKVAMAAFLSVAGTLAAWFQQAGYLGIFFGLFGGIALGLFIANEVSARRIVRRFKDIEPSPEGEDEPLEPEKVISAYIIVADQLYIEGLTQVTEETQEEWAQRILNWTAGVSTFLRNQFSEKEVVLFTNTAGLRPETFSENFSATHNGNLTVLDRFRGNLREVLREL